MKEDHNYVYVMAAVENGVPVAPCKIGITRNLDSRLASIQTGNPKKLAVVSAIYIPSRYAADVIEAAIHEWFDEFRLTGEWFSVGPIDAAIGCCSMAKDVFLGMGMDEEGASECLKNLGITATIKRCFDYVDHCKAKSLPLETRF